MVAGIFLYVNKSEPSAAPAPEKAAVESVGVVKESVKSTATPEQIPSPGQKTFVVTGSNFAFAPSVLTVKKGDRVKITFKNAAGFHDFNIDGFAVATQKIRSGAEETVEFTADKTGSFEYYCSIGEHRAMGMKGTLIVQ